MPFVSAIEINEIMYNPPGDDTSNEWIELYNPEKIDITNWTIGDLASNDTLIPIKITNSDYILIVENASAFNDSDASVYYAGSTIGNGLGNTGDTILFYNLNKTLVDFVVYNNTFANGNNKTLEKFNFSWYESIVDGGTPGFQNSIVFGFSNITNQTNSTNNTTNQTNATNSTNSTINETNQASSTCISKISINTTKDIFTDESIKFRHIVNSSEDNFSIVYWIEDLFGNVVKKQYETKTLTEKSFTPHPSEKDTVYIIKSILKGCNESYAEKIVIYKTNKDIEDEPVDTRKEETSKNSETSNNTKQKFSYELISYSEEIMQNDEANAVVKITSDNSPHEVYIQAYIYRYSKKYSEIAEQEFTIERFESEIAELNFFTNATPGDYKMKIKITKDELKTPYEITRNVTVVKNPDLENQLNETNDEKNISIIENKTTETNKSIIKPQNITNETIIYQSKKAKSEYLVPVIIISILAVVSGVLIWKR